MSLELIYEGKAKKIYATEDSSKVLVEFKNSLTAFNALKKGEFENKGVINRNISSILFKQLAKKNIALHWIEDREPNFMLVEKVEIIPLEIVVRNTLAGSTAKKLGFAEGAPLKKPLLELYYKNDSLADPFLSDDQAFMLEIVTEDELNQIKELAFKINNELKQIFAAIKIDLIDFKIEFGKNLKKQILLADEITPDCARLWDMDSNEKLDKDRFRRDLGAVKESYEEVLKRLQSRFL